MFALSSCCRSIPITAFVSGLKSTVGRPSNLRFYANEGFRTGSRVVRRRTLKETLTQPATDTPYAVGRLAAAGAAAFGVGALAYYGMGLAKEGGALENSMLWPQYVRDRVHSTYMYLGGGLTMTAGAAALVFRSPTLMNLMTKNSLLSLVATFAAMIGTGMICRSIPYEPGSLTTKRLAWALHCGVMGAVIAPLALFGGPIIMRAALYTAGIVGGLSAIAATAPSDKFLQMGGMLGIGLGVVFVSSIGTFFLPPTSMLGAGLWSIALYGGLVLFSAFMLYDTQRLIKMAENYPSYAARPYDPINAQLSIYMNTLNIFIRLVMIFGGAGGNRRK